MVPGPTATTLTSALVEVLVTVRAGAVVMAGVMVLVLALEPETALDPVTAPVAVTDEASVPVGAGDAATVTVTVRALEMALEPVGEMAGEKELETTPEIPVV